MARDTGLQIIPYRLLEGEKEVHFLTERFDRSGNEKVHVQTLAALSPSASSYEGPFETAYKIGIPLVELQLLFRSTVINAPHYINRHSMMINGKTQAITREDLFRLAKRYNIKSAGSSIEKAVGIVRNYQFYREKAGVSDYWIHTIKEEITSRIENLSHERT